MHALRTGTAFILLALISICARVVHGQGITPHQNGALQTAPEYDVVSIKLNNTGGNRVDVDSNDNTYIATNIRVKQLLEQAYSIKEDLISGVPDDVASARFDINAKILQSDPEELKKLRGKESTMVLAFLVDRFSLRAHTETRILPVYELLTSKHGIKFRQSPVTNEPGTHIAGNGRTNFTAHNLSMDTLASVLSEKLHRTVLNHTKLAGDYDLTLRWTPEDLTETQNEDGVSIFTALQEQLGLMLKAAKGPVQTLVVDQMTMPSPN